MTDTEATEPTTTARPVRVPNVSPGAISGLGHAVIGSASQEVYDAEATAQDDAAESQTSVSGLQGTGQRVEGTQSPADSDSPLTGDGDPTNGALPTGDSYVVGDYTVEQVNAYLDDNPAMVEQVLAAEADGKARVGILEGPHA